MNIIQADFFLKMLYLEFCTKYLYSWFFLFRNSIRKINLSQIKLLKAANTFSFVTIWRGLQNLVLYSYFRVRAGLNGLFFTHNQYINVLSQTSTNQSTSTKSYYIVVRRISNYTRTLLNQLHEILEMRLIGPDIVQ